MNKVGVEVLKPGMLTTVQDLGRSGYQKYGVIKSGAMDTVALRIANMLVGNKEHEAALEMTLFGASLLFQQDALISLTGGDMSPTINGKSVHTYRSIYVQEGSILKIGQAKRGCRVYLAIAGGIKVSEVMHSYSTYLRAGIGGYGGRALQKNDIIYLKKMNNYNEEIWKRVRQESKVKGRFQESSWTVHPELKSELTADASLRVFVGNEYDWFTDASKHILFSKSFSISTESDRMGYRLEGEPLELSNRKELLSAAVTFGTVQVPADGMPIILMADRQTTGGYAKIAQIASVDLQVAAQLKPGDSITFKKISHREAEQLYLVRERNMKALRLGVGLYC